MTQVMIEFKSASWTK